MYYERDLRRMLKRYNNDGGLDSVLLAAMFRCVYGVRPFKPHLAVDILERRLTHPVWRYLAADRAGYNRKRKAKILKTDVAATPLQARFWVERGMDPVGAAAKAKEVATRGSAVLKDPGVSARRKEAIRNSTHKISESLRAYWQDDSRAKEAKAAAVKRATAALREGSAHRQSHHFSSNVSFWTRKGYTEDEAAKIIGAKSRADLESFVRKHGVSEGTRRFESMVASRKARWEAKSEEERNAINDKRRNNSHVGIYTESVCAGIGKLNFYAFVTNGGVKYGLTKHDSLVKRWPRRLVERVLFFVELDAIEAYNLERECAEKFGKNRCVAVGTTEWFECADTEEFCSFIRRKLDV